MAWQAWALIAVLTINIIYQWYLVDRPRQPKTHGEAFWATAEVAFYIYLVVALAT